MSSRRSGSPTVRKVGSSRGGSIVKYQTPSHSRGASRRREEITVDEESDVQIDLPVIRQKISRVLKRMSVFNLRDSIEILGCSELNSREAYESLKKVLDIAADTGRKLETIITELKKENAELKERNSQLEQEADDRTMIADEDDEENTFVPSLYPNKNVSSPLEKLSFKHSGSVISRMPPSQVFPVLPQPSQNSKSHFLPPPIVETNNPVSTLPYPAVNILPEHGPGKKITFVVLHYSATVASKEEVFKLFKIESEDKALDEWHFGHDEARGEYIILLKYKIRKVASGSFTFRTLGSNILPSTAAIPVSKDIKAVVSYIKNLSDSKSWNDAKDISDEEKI